MIDAYLSQHREAFEQDMFKLLAIPSVSTDNRRSSDVRRCAEEVARQMREAGLEEVQLRDTPGHPVVYGHWVKAPGKPTVLVYGHYDVQPEDPVDLWTSPPFQPTVRDGKVYARGATDDKGQFLTHIKAVQALLATRQELPVNIKFLIEGEEEVGSPNLAPFLRENRGLLAADLLVVSDSAMFAPGIPSIVYGLRGLAYVQVDLKGADSDLHSGIFGGAVPNPGFELCRLIAQLKDERGRVTVPGFYDKVRNLEPEERAEYANLPFDEEEFRASLGVPGLHGEEGYTCLERKSARPTLEINGMLCGYTGEGAKTVLPNKAMAKISCRLVPDQDPEEIAELLARHIRDLLPATVEANIRSLHGGKPWITPRSHPALKAAARALEREFGRHPVFVREGGSIPIVVDFEQILGLPGILLGFGLNDENLHAPNEHFDLGNYHRGIRTVTYLLEELAGEPGRLEATSIESTV
ncbi:MAG: dipeptidase [Candidatus Eremiobacterota bacterium]